MTARSSSAPRTVRELQRKLSSRRSVGWADRMDLEDLLNGATVFERLPDGRVATSVHESGERVMPRVFDSEADAVAFTDAEIYGTGPSTRRRRRREGPAPRTVEDLQAALADLGKDPDSVGRYGLPSAPYFEGVTMVAVGDDGVDSFVFDRGQRHSEQHHASESDFVADYARRYLPEEGPEVTDLDVERMRARARARRRSWESWSVSGSES